MPSRPTGRQRQRAVVRAARPADAASVATVLVESRRVHLPYAPLAHADDEVRAWVADVLLPGGRVVVCEQSGAVVGVLATSVVDGLHWIDQLYLMPGRTGAGLGSMLLAHAHACLGRPIRLYTFQQNVGARRFYERHGYAAVAFTDGRDNEERCPDVLLELA
jgi:ribosomal protein S18 acetylase RimI-like enzyme